MLYYSSIDTPLGVSIHLAASDLGLCCLHFGTDDAALVSHVQRRFGKDPIRDDEKLGASAETLRGYFAGTVRDFDLALDPRGTPFQQTVWEALRQIPYGETRSYREIAATIGRPTAVRAVAAANAANPLAVIVPCHRVIGADGQLRGYAGGVDIKRALLELERRHG